ncbi:MAG: acetate--CoA ligase [Desulfomonile tiedjei]|nr:acetate--CoA ligase [Desulfomonile tiedjei]
MTANPKMYDGHLAKFGGTAHVRTVEEYEKLYKNSLDDPDAYWSGQAREYLSWYKQWDFVLRHDWEEARIEWFGGGILNASYNCLDRHLETSGNKIAYHWEGDGPDESKTVTYLELYNAVNKFAAVLKSVGVEKGDPVIIYMPMTVDLPVTMLACARIGAVHCVVFSGYSAEYLANRISDCGAKVVVTSDAAFRAGRLVQLKARVDEARQLRPEIERVIVFKRGGPDLELDKSIEMWAHEAASDPALPSFVEPVPMDAEDPLFILYASAAIGHPRGLVHTHGGYLLWTAMTARLIFDLREHDTFWSTGDIGWINGHSFSVYGPLLNAQTTVLFEGVPSFPDYGRYWEIISKYRVSKFYTVPTVIRTLLKEGGDLPAKYDLSSLQILGTAGEPMTWEAWEWFYQVVGRQKCPIMDTWWQAESGGPMMTPLPGVGPIKPGSVSLPFFGVEPVILDLDTGAETKFPNQEGAFFIKRPWPGMARTIYRDHEAFKEAYFAPFGGLFITGDGAKRDAEGFYWMMGRIDDVINVSSHRIGAWEIETALISHDSVAEAAVVGFPHPIKGEGIYVFIRLNSGGTTSDHLKEELTGLLRKKIGGIAAPDAIQWADALPKTPSGKTLRRLLQKIAAGQIDDLGDVSTVADPAVIKALIRNRISV